MLVENQGPTEGQETAPEQTGGEAITTTATTETAETEVERKLHEAVERRKGDAVALEELAQKMVEAKKKANSDAKAWREKFEALEAKQAEAETLRQEAELTAIQKLERQLEEKDITLKQYEAKLQDELTKQANKEFAWETKQAGVEDTELVEYLLEKHLKGIQDDEDALADFELGHWLKVLKTERPKLFKTEKPKKEELGETGIPAETQKPKEKHEPSVLGERSTSREDRVDRDRKWQEYLTAKYQK